MGPQRVAGAIANYAQAVRWAIAPDDRGNKINALSSHNIP
jgi:hypothetical protein